MTEPRRSLWVLGTGDLAGVGRHALDVAEIGVPGWALSFLLPDGPLARELRLRGAEVVACPTGFGKQYGVRRGIGALRHALRATRACLVHSHLSWADVVVSLASARSGVASVTTEHGIADVPGLYNSRPSIAHLKRRLHRWRLRRTDGVIAVSRATQKSMRTQWGPFRVRADVVVHNGVETPEAVAPRLGLRLATLCRLAPEKRVDRVLRAFALVLRERPDATLGVCGTGPMTKELQHLARHLELGDSVTFPGHVLPADLWGHVDIVVQASAWENCSYSLLDAIVQGRGVVASDVGGNREFLPSSCLVGRGAEPDEIARAVIDQERLAHRLPSDWPSRPDMTAAIAGVYEQVTKHRRETPNGGDHRPAVVGTEG